MHYRDTRYGYRVNAANAFDTQDITSNRNSWLYTSNEEFLSRREYSPTKYYTTLLFKHPPKQVHMSTSFLSIVSIGNRVGSKIHVLASCTFQFAFLVSLQATVEVLYIAFWSHCVRTNATRVWRCHSCGSRRSSA